MASPSLTHGSVHFDDAKPQIAPSDIIIFVFSKVSFANKKEINNGNDSLS